MFFHAYDVCLSPRYLQRFELFMHHEHKKKVPSNNNGKNKNIHCRNLEKGKQNM